MYKCFFVFIFSCGIIFGATYNINRYFNFEHSPDSKSYIKMASGDYNVTITHKYRFAIPLIVNQLANISTQCGIQSARTTFVLFLVINTIFIALASVFIFLILEYLGFSFLVSLLGILPFLTSRWGVFATALPLVESLFIFSICGFLYAIIAKKHTIALIFILMGPLSKESFWLYMPLVFLFFEKSKINPNYAIGNSNA